MYHDALTCCDVIMDPCCIHPLFIDITKYQRQAISEESLNNSVPARPVEGSSTVTEGQTERGRKEEITVAKESRREEAFGQAWDFLWRNNKTLVRITLIPSTWGHRSLRRKERRHNDSIWSRSIAWLCAPPPEFPFPWKADFALPVMGLSVPITPQRKEKMGSILAVTEQLVH